MTLQQHCSVFIPYIHSYVNAGQLSATCWPLPPRTQLTCFCSLFKLCCLVRWSHVGCAMPHCDSNDSHNVTLTTAMVANIKKQCQTVSEIAVDVAIAKLHSLTTCGCVVIICGSASRWPGSSSAVPACWRCQARTTTDMLAQGLLRCQTALSMTLEICVMVRAVVTVIASHTVAVEQLYIQLHHI